MNENPHLNLDMNEIGHLFLILKRVISGFEIGNMINLSVRSFHLSDLISVDIVNQKMIYLLGWVLTQNREMKEIIIIVDREAGQISASLYDMKKDFCGFLSDYPERFEQERLRSLDRINKSKKDSNAH